MTPTPNRIGYLPETPAQTAGPYVHIGLIPHQAGFDIFEKNFSNDLAAACGRRGDGSGGGRRGLRWSTEDAARHTHTANTANNCGGKRREKTAPVQLGHNATRCGGKGVIGAIRGPRPASRRRRCFRQPVRRMGTTSQDLRPF